MPILKVLDNYISSKSDEQYILEYTNRYFIYEKIANIVKVIYKVYYSKTCIYRDENYKKIKLIPEIMNLWWDI